ncbi:MAG: hypothetical protein HY716_13400 [Planctomycetes bacterium]|nr:hypothetical protein [Planctomycetota bacterium]
MKKMATLGLWFAAAATALAQDQQIGARTKGMGGSYTAFEDDPISVWLNPAGIATQPDQMSISYQTYVAYPVHQSRSFGDEIKFEVEPETVLVDPAILPAYLGFVFQVGDVEAPTAIGVCVARPYHINYALDQVSDPSQTEFQPENNVEEAFTRFRVALARDFIFASDPEDTWFTHLAVGAGLDVGYQRWQFFSTSGNISDNALSFGAGAGLLFGLYDDKDSLKVNLGLAYQSAMKFEFNIEPDILPAFDMPQQFNAGMTFYLLEGTPLRVTVDLQWINWSETAENPIFPGQPKFEDVVNYSIGFEYRLQIPAISDKVLFYPRLGFRRFDAPWDDKDDLPMTGAFKLVLDTDDEAFTIFTAGLGVSWTTEAGKVRTVDLAIDTGGDSFNVAVGYNHEF